MLFRSRYSIGVDKIGKKNFDPKNCSTNGQKFPKFVKICQNLAKNYQNIGFFWPKSSKNDQYFWYWCCIGPPRNFFRYSIGLESIFGPKMTLVLVLGRKNFDIFFYRIGLEMDFLAKNFGYWYWVNLTKIQNAVHWSCYSLVLSTIYHSFIYLIYLGLDKTNQFLPPSKNQF